MKKFVLITGMIGAALLTGIPAFAINMDPAENTTCQGPARIGLANTWYKRAHTASATDSELCRAEYEYDHSFAGTDAQAQDWAYDSHLSSLLVPQANENLLLSVQPFLPKGAMLQHVSTANPDDILTAYRVTEKHPDENLLHFIVFRTIRQQDGSARIYQFRFSTQVQLSSQGTPLDPAVIDEGYDHFNQVVKNYRYKWISDMAALQTEN